jgi:hypothetical protein
MNAKKTTYRYPGVKPFEANDAPLFFGRDRDIADLLDFVKREQLVVLFGKSGYGKSSLLKAGLLPQLGIQPNITVDQETGEEQVLPNCPIYIRFSLYGKSNQAMMPCDTVLDILKKETSSEDEYPELLQFFKETQLPPSLWSAFKCNRIAGEQHIYLIFDQFEEFFSYPAEAQLIFKKQLSELLYTKIPQQVRDVMADYDRATKRLLHQPLRVHALFAIRSDRIHLLNSMQEELPEILNKRYELKALTDSQAEEAIVKPAQLVDDNFLLKQPFEYAPEALKKIIFELKKAQKNNSEFEMQSQIEAFQLQIVCQKIEQSLVTQTRQGRGVQPILVNENELPEFGKIYEQYYTDRLSALPDEPSKVAAHVLLEEEMVIGKGLNEVRRISIDRDLLKESLLEKHQITIGQELLDELENNFLIRREIIGGRVHYELSHDVLLAPALKSRDVARVLKAEKQAADLVMEQQMAAEKRAKDAEEQTRIERELRLSAERGRLQYVRLTYFVGFLLLLAGMTSVWALNQRTKAKKAQVEVEKARDEAYDAKVAAEKATQLALLEKDAANKAILKVIAVYQEKLTNQIILDKKAGFKKSAKANQDKLDWIILEIDKNTAPEKILNQLEK